jgi:hypothetical protein
MSRTARFVPREYLVVPNLWGFSESEVEWTLAVDWDDAVHLARAREQHALAYPDRSLARRTPQLGGRS